MLVVEVGMTPHLGGRMNSSVGDEVVEVKEDEVDMDFDVGGGG